MRGISPESNEEFISPVSDQELIKNYGTVKPTLEQVTANPADRYKFRTAPLRNIALQPAFMHDGAFTNLRDAIRYQCRANPPNALGLSDGCEWCKNQRMKCHNAVCTTLQCFFRNSIR